jgi:hypothetical protein
MSEALQRGDEAAVIRPVGMKTISGSSLGLSPPTIVVMREVEAKRLKVVVGRVSWINRSAVMAGGSDESATLLVLRGVRKTTSLPNSDDPLAVI